MFRCVACIYLLCHKNTCRRRKFQIFARKLDQNWAVWSSRSNSFTKPCYALCELTVEIKQCPPFLSCRFCLCSSSSSIPNLPTVTTLRIEVHPKPPRHWDDLAFKLPLGFPVFPSMRTEEPARDRSARSGRSFWSAKQIEANKDPLFNLPLIHHHLPMQSLE